MWWKCQASAQGLLWVWLLERKAVKQPLPMQDQQPVVLPPPSVHLRPAGPHLTPVESAVLAGPPTVLLSQASLYHISCPFPFYPLCPPGGASCTPFLGPACLHGMLFFRPPCALICFMFWLRYHRLHEPL